MESFGAGVTAVIASLGDGLQLALSFNPVIALLGSAASAGVLTVGKGGRRTFAGISLLTGFWLVGDGLRVMARARDLADGVSALPPGWLGWATLAVWGIGGLAVGYGLPSWAGTFAGRRVTFGTGWLTAIVVSVSLSLSISALLGGLG